MTIPTRDELIERARARLSGLHTTVYEVIADFALSEIRRAVAEELEALHREVEQHKNAIAPGPTRQELLTVVVAIQNRLAALREQTEQTNSRPAPPATDCPASEGSAAQGVADRAIPARDLTRSATPDLHSKQPPGAATVAEPRLERAKTVEGAADRAEGAAPVPAPKPADVFEAFDREWHAWDRGGEPLSLCGLARDWFFPLVAALEQIEADSYEEKTVGLASAALEPLRRRAQEASR